MAKTAIRGKQPPKMSKGIGRRRPSSRLGTMEAAAPARKLTFLRVVGLLFEILFLLFSLLLLLIWTGMQRLRGVDFFAEAKRLYERLMVALREALRGALLVFRAMTILVFTICLAVLLTGSLLLGAGMGEVRAEEGLVSQEPSKIEEQSDEAGADTNATSPRPSDRRPRAADRQPERAAPSSLEAPPSEAPPRERSPARASHQAAERPKKPASCSAGTRVSGPLLHPARLLNQGQGFERVLPHRDLSYGTDELVGSITRAAAALYDPSRPPLMVGNLSGPQGDQAGSDPFHPARFSRGQGAGRSADLLFFVSDALGRPAPAVDPSVPYDDEGRSMAAVRRLYLDDQSTIPDGCHRLRAREGLVEVGCPMPPGALRIDFGQTWKLVRALLTDPAIGAIDALSGEVRPRSQGIRFIFVSQPFKERLLEVARETNEPREVLAAAESTLHAPSNAPAFNRFLRLELRCTPEDRLECACKD